jgi:hypothetical protein
MAADRDLAVHAARELGMFSKSKALALALAELKKPSHPWVANALSDYPLKRGARRKPLTVVTGGRHRLYFPTVDPDIYMRVIVSKSSTGMEVSARLSPAIHACLLVTSNVMSKQQLADRLGGRPSPYASEGVWSLNSKLSYPGEAEEHVENVLQQLDPHGPALSQLVRKKHAVARMCVIMKEVPGFDLLWIIQPTTLGLLARYGIILNFQRALASAVR